jgi:aminomethyltransferase
VHAELGATLTDFAGWLMPLRYGSETAEHNAVRSAAGLFDLSHMGDLAVTGAGAAEALDYALVGEMSAVRPGRARYTMICAEDGGVVDDLIVYREDDGLFLVPNAANTDSVVRLLADEAPAGVDIANRHRDIATIAVQGPRSADVLAAVGLPADMDYMAFARADWRGSPVVVCRTGYTGEHGYELMPPAEQAGELWDELLAAATPLGGLPCGLGARDTLRTEMGYPLHGQDLSVAVTPVQARLGWAVGWDKPAFWGREVIVREREVGAPRLLWGLRGEDRGIPRPHMAVRSHDDEDLGEVTSGTFSPTLKVGIGLAYLSRAVGEDAEVRVDVRGRPLPMRAVKLPFVPSHVR